MGPGPDGPMGGMGGMEQHHMNGSLGEWPECLKRLLGNRLRPMFCSTIRGKNDLLWLFCGSVYSLFWYKRDKKGNQWRQGCKSLVTLKNLEENWLFILVLFLMTGSGDMDGLPKVRQILWLTLGLACLFNFFLFIFWKKKKNTRLHPSSAELSQQHGGHEQSSRHSAGWRRDGRQLFKPIPKWKCEYWAQLRAS